MSTYPSRFTRLLTITIVTWLVTLPLHSQSSLNLDPSFNPNVAGAVFAVAVQGDGKIIIGGEFTRVGPTQRNNIARLNANGTLDSTFNIGSGANGPIRCLAVQADGKILAGGDFTQVNGQKRGYIVRLKPNGAVESNSAFNLGDGISQGMESTPGSKVGKTVLCLAIQADGKIVIGGHFSMVNGTLARHLVRLNPNGFLDNSFVFGGTDFPVESVGVQSDAKILIGGHFFGLRPQAGNSKRIEQSSIARLNTDGTVDATFKPTSKNLNGVLALVAQKDGIVLAAGNFNETWAGGRNGLARLNSNGEIDTAFNPRIGRMSPPVNWGINALAVQADGKVLVGGNFSFMGETIDAQKPPPPTVCVARFGPDGNVESVASLSGTNSVVGLVHSIAVGSGGTIIVGGRFNSMNGVPRNSLAQFR